MGIGDWGLGIGDFNNVQNVGIGDNPKLEKNEKKDEITFFDMKYNKYFLYDELLVDKNENKKYLIVSICMSCSIMFYNTFNDPGTLIGMFEGISKFHFIPLLCVSALFIIGECLKIDVKNQFR